MPLKESVLGRRRAVARGAVWIFAALHILAISGSEKGILMVFLAVCSACSLYVSGVYKGYADASIREEQRIVSELQPSLALRLSFPFPRHAPMHTKASPELRAVSAATILGQSNVYVGECSCSRTTSR